MDSSWFITLRYAQSNFINKNTTPKRGVVSATYPNDTSAARCIGRRQRNIIHMSSPRQGYILVSVSELTAQRLMVALLPSI